MTKQSLTRPIVRGVVEDLIEAIPAAPVNTVAPTIAGTAQSGEILTFNRGAWTGSPTPSYTYQAQDDGVNIAGATASTLLLTYRELGGVIPCQITATNSEGTVTVETAATSAVIAASDTVPNAFTFTAITEQELSTLVESNEVTITGINEATPISVVGGEYSINGGAYTSATGTINNNDDVKTRGTTPAGNEEDLTVTLTIGGVDGVFVATTKVLVDETEYLIFDAPDGTNTVAGTGTKIATWTNQGAGPNASQTDSNFQPNRLGTDGFLTFVGANLERLAMDDVDFGTDSFSFGGWINADAATTNQTLFAMSIMSNNLLRFYLNSTSGNDAFLTLNLRQDNDGSGAGFVSKTASTAARIPLAGTWVHFHVNVDRINDTADIYVNKVLSKSTSIAGITRSYTAPTTAISVGTSLGGNVQNYNLSSNMFTGKIEAFKAYKEIRTVAEITADYNEGLNAV